MLCVKKREVDVDRWKVEEFMHYRADKEGLIEMFKGYKDCNKIQV